MSTTPRKYYPAGGSETVAFYTTQNSRVYVTFHDGREQLSRTLRNLDALKRALLCGGLTTTEPVREMAGEQSR